MAVMCQAMIMIGDDDDGGSSSDDVVDDDEDNDDYDEEVSSDGDGVIGNLIMLGSEDEENLKHVKA